ncbi:MAG: hypothetical protein WBN08_13260, partial [Thiogranum sp.]
VDAEETKALKLLATLWLPETSYGPGMRTIALPVLSTLLGLIQSRALLHLEILALRQQHARSAHCPTLTLAKPIC